MHHYTNSIRYLEIGESIQIEEEYFPNADRSIRLINMAYREAQRAGISITAEKIDNYTVLVTRIQVN